MYKDYILGKKAVLFDLDGTIVDNLHYWEEAVTNVAGTLDIGSSPNSKLVYKGVCLTEIWKDFITESKVKNSKSLEDLVKETKDAYLKIISTEESIEPRYGFWSLLREFKDKKFLVGLVSNSSKDVVDIMLNKLDIKYELFDVVVTGDEVKNKKPHPEIYLTAAKKLKTNPKEILVFEDSVIGAISANKAGMDLIVIWSGQFPEYDYPEKTLTFLDDFHSLPGNLDQTFMEYFKQEAQKSAPPGAIIK
ncbi:hypothetical protein A2V49_04425 [candidate division WWE3 bacterium RBG_19FT_COMBO_34_6]|uniref:FCP1 homology domain-containing protein n=1 Tax=candidate division WWE3 bacterium RBG_19FT_COMBO_34_6 TaxID=1802612 RepID=A0A1F4UML9_UNCKA|nr:MAG: hypothetical protein A2V49_04425 [candidate division WWE3 bacterium RBG_19FT_COMBO_34_6]